MTELKKCPLQQIIQKGDGKKEKNIRGRDLLELA